MGAALAALQPGAGARAATPPTWPFPAAGAPPSFVVPPIVNPNPLLPSAPSNPVAPSSGNPLAGDQFFVDRQSAAAKAAQRYPALNTIAREPGAARFGSFSFGANGIPDIRTAVSRYLTRTAVQAPGTVPMMATYRVVDGHCGNWADPPADQAAYHNFIQGFAQGIGSTRAVLFLEMDSLITTPCLSPQGVDVRMRELSDAINVLTANCPGLVIYLDAGAADALPARQAASLLGRAGVAKIQGFFLNATHYDWTSKEIAYGEQISRLTGGKHFVVNTGENGQGPLVPSNVAKNGNEVLCNPPGRGLGPLPTSNTGHANVDAFAWTSNPGESGGKCVPGAPPTGAYWPQYGLMLVHNANFAVGKPASVRPAHVHKARRRKSTR
jgi:endoglucanase